MAATAKGSRIVITGAAGRIVLRALRATEIEGGWGIPVMADLADVAALERADAQPDQLVAELSTDEGPMRLDAEIVRAGGMFLVRAAGLRPASITEQRRDNVRAPVALGVRGTILSGSNVRSSSSVRQDGPEGPSAVLAGTTNSVSAGGVCVLFGALPAGAGAGAGARLYLELSMPGGELAPAVVRVLERQPVAGGVQVRARFLDISPLDSERLVRIVFARQRSELAERRNAVRPL